VHMGSTDRYTRLPLDHFPQAIDTEPTGRVKLKQLRVSDSQVIKAALLLAQPDKRLLKAYQEIRGADQRYRQEPEG
jgi:hypothetical protein